MGPAAKATYKLKPAVISFKSQTAVCVEVVMKRLRAFRKRLTKIERAESLKRSELNKDQLELIQRKPEVTGTIKELEEILKQLTLTEQEELKQVAETTKERETEERTRLEEALSDAKACCLSTFHQLTWHLYEPQAQSDHTLRESLRLLHALNVCLPKISTISISLTETQFGALTQLSSILNGNVGPHVTIDETVQRSEEVLRKYIEKSNDDFYQGVTYAELESLVASLLSPPKLPKFGMLGNGDVTFDETSVKSVSIKDGVPRPVIPLHAINFINPSEVL
ncbi:hypothetical protein HDU97_002594 [Phlyctochytrium planicorne]|nr:hypothetical protein HDU97_002594 [Phlyctochytrium planicorne]